MKYETLKKLIREIIKDEPIVKPRGLKGYNASHVIKPRRRFKLGTEPWWEEEVEEDSSED